MKIHNRKTDPSNFGEISRGVKTYEVCEIDPEVDPGDLIVFMQHDGSFTGDTLVAHVQHKTIHGGNELPNGFCVLGFSLIGGGLHRWIR
jgi:hypothetical protein